MRSANLTIPEKDDYLKFTLNADLPTLNGRPAAERGRRPQRRCYIPNVYSGLLHQPHGAYPEIIRTDEGEPEQYFFVHTKGYVEGAELEKHLQVWFIPEAEETEKTISVLPACQRGDGRGSSRDFKMTPVTLKRVETEKEEGAPVSESHGFKFLVEKPGSAFGPGDQGGEGSLGGFRLDRRRPCASL